MSGDNGWAQRHGFLARIVHLVLQRPYLQTTVSKDGASTTTIQPFAGKMTVLNSSRYRQHLLCVVTRTSVHLQAHEILLPLFHYCYSSTAALAPASNTLSHTGPRHPHPLRVTACSTAWLLLIPTFPSQLPFPCCAQRTLGVRPPMVRQDHMERQGLRVKHYVRGGEKEEAPKGTKCNQSNEKALLIIKARVVSVSEGEKSQWIEEYEKLRGRKWTSFL